MSNHPHRSTHNPANERANHEIATARAAEIHRCSGHEAIDSIDQAFSGPVGDGENPMAHGNITRVETCRCGAERHSNINGMHVERGAWA